MLKIDKSFVDGMSEYNSDAAIAQAVTHMAHSLGMKVIAEGVETAEQRACLEAYGCDEIQGYLYSRPLDFEAFTAFLVSAAARSIEPVNARGDARSLGPN